MNELAAYQSNLPATIEDTARFIVLGQEKAKSLSAEIKAIKRLDLAKEVYDQKMKELENLRLLMFDAYYKMGEFTQSIPKATKWDAKENNQNPSSGNFITAKTKSETIKDLGLSTSQVQRFETMAKHPDIIEQVKADVKAGIAEPTQTEVLRRIKEVTPISEIRQDQARRELDDAVNVQKFHKIMNGIATMQIPDEMIEAVAMDDNPVEETLFDLLLSIELLTSIRNKIISRRCKNGKTN